MWLTSGRWPRAAWLVAVSVFIAFGCYSLVEAIEGAPTCNCFGAVSVSPWISLALDVGALAGLFYALPAKMIQTLWSAIGARGLICAMIGILFLGGWIAEIARSSSGGRSNRLFVDPQELQLKDLWYQDQVHFKFTIHNSSEKEIKIRDFRTSCSCTSVEPKSVTIPAHASQVVDCLWKPTNSSISQIDRFSGSFSAQILPICEDREGHALANRGWSFSGRVHQQLKLSTARITFENGALTAGEQFPEKLIEVTLSPWVTQITATFDESIIRCHLDRVDPQKYILRVHPIESLNAGELDTNISLVCSNSEFEPIPTVVVPVRGRIGQDVFVTPELLDIGFVEAGNATEEDIAIQSKSLRRFTVDKAVCLLEDVNLTVSPTDGDQMQRIKVRVHPSKVGRYQGDIQVVCTRIDDSTRFELTIPCTYVATTHTHLNGP